jgi:hypothetical protein
LFTTAGFHLGDATGVLTARTASGAAVRGTAPVVVVR